MSSVNGFEVLTVADTAVGPTQSLLLGPTLGGDASRKGMAANLALLGPLETGQVRWRDDGTAPTSSVGHLLEVGQSLEYDGDLYKIKFIRTGGTSGSLPATYYKRSNRCLA